MYETKTDAKVRGISQILVGVVATGLVIYDRVGE